MGFAWDAPDIETLKTLWTEGLTASQIASALQDKYTRSAICAKASRMNLPIRAGIAERRANGTPYNHRTKPHIHRQYPSKPKLVISDVSPVPELEPLCAPGEPADGNMCRWPSGDTGTQDFRFCGHPQAPSKPYCAHHASRAYMPPRPAKP